MRRALLETSKHTRTSLRTQSAPRCASFSSTSRRPYAEAKNESKSDGKKKSEERPGTAGKSPFAVFVDVLREELQKSKDLQEGVKQLQGSATEAMDSEAMKKAKAYYEKARVGLSAGIHVSMQIR